MQHFGNLTTEDRNLFLQVVAPTLINKQELLINNDEKGLIILKKSDLEEMLTNVSISNRIDNRKKYVSHKEAIIMYNITDYWLKNQREDPNSKIICIPGEHNNTSWKYKIESIQHELDRLAV